MMARCTSYRKAALNAIMPSKPVDTRTTSGSTVQRLPNAARYQGNIKSAFAKRYKSGEDVWSKETAMAAASRFFVGHFHHSAAMILDIGAGVGRDVEFYARHGHSVVGLDLIGCENWGNIEQRFSGHVSFLVGCFPDIELSERFNVICDNGCFHHQHPEKWLGYFSRIWELLHPEGLFCVNLFASEKDVRETTQFLRPDGRLSKHFSFLEISNLLNANGFSVVDYTLIDRNLRDLRYIAVVARKQLRETQGTV